MNNNAPRRMLAILLVTLFILNLLPLSVVVAEELLPGEHTESSPGEESEAEPSLLQDQASQEATDACGQLPPGSNPNEPAVPPEQDSDPCPLGEQSPLSEPDTPPAGTETASTPEPVSAPNPDEAPPLEPGNSYVATVIPEDGKEVKAGEETTLTVTFTEVGSDTNTASARLYIPDTLSVNRNEELEPTPGWAYSWEDPQPNSSFSAVLSLWAILESAILGRNQSVSVDISVTASADETHTFQAEAWQDRAVENGSGTGIGSFPNEKAAGYSEPRINVPVSSAEELDSVRQNLNWHYVQQQNIDLSASAAGQDWQPIGSSAAPFAGAYNGGNHTISNLTINNPDENYRGLFGQADPTSIICDLTLESFSIEGKQFVGGLVAWLQGGVIRNVSASGAITANSSYAGGIAGRNYGGLITNSHTNVTVQGTTLVGGLCGQNYEGQVVNSSAAGTFNGNSQVGGLIGSNFRSLVKGSNSSGSVNATLTGDAQAGGLIGYNRNDSIVNNCFSTAAVFAVTGSRAGGLVGENNSSAINFSYATGAVDGISELGGLVGCNFSDGEVSNCYATGNISGTSMVGGLAGLNAGTIASSYALGTVTAESASGGLVGATNNQNNDGFYDNNQPENNLGNPLSVTALKTLSTYSNAGWSIADLAEFDLSDPSAYYWYIEPGISFPTLWWQHLPPAEPPLEEGEEGQGNNPQPAPGPGNFNENSNYNNPNNLFHLQLLNRQTAFGIPGFLVMTGSARTSGKPLFNSYLVTSGSSSDLFQAEAAYNKAFSNYIFLKETNPLAVHPLHLLDLALARAAILALHLRLNSDLALLPAAQEAYRQSLQLFNQYSHLLTESQKLQAETMLSEIWKVLSNLNIQQLRPIIVGGFSVEIY